MGQMPVLDVGGNSLLYLTSEYLKEKGEPHGSPSPKYDGHKVAKFL